MPRLSLSSLDDILSSVHYNPDRHHPRSAKMQRDPDPSDPSSGFPQELADAVFPHLPDTPSPAVSPTNKSVALPLPTHAEPQPHNLSISAPRFWHPKYRSKGKATVSSSVDAVMPSPQYDGGAVLQRSPRLRRIHSISHNIPKRANTVLPIDTTAMTTSATSAPITIPSPMPSLGDWWAPHLSVCHAHDESVQKGEQYEDRVRALRSGSDDGLEMWNILVPEALPEYARPHHFRSYSMTSLPDHMLLRRRSSPLSESSSLDSLPEVCEAAPNAEAEAEAELDTETETENETQTRPMSVPGRHPSLPVGSGSYSPYAPSAHSPLSTTAPLTPASTISVSAAGSDEALGLNLNLGRPSFESGLTFGEVEIHRPHRRSIVIGAGEREHAPSRHSSLSSEIVPAPAGEDLDEPDMWDLEDVGRQGNTKTITEWEWEWENKWDGRRRGTVRPDCVCRTSCDVETGGARCEEKRGRSRERSPRSFSVGLQ